MVSKLNEEFLSKQKKLLENFYIKLDNTNLNNEEENIIIVKFILKL